eukprot:jgi/Tetstr1/425830/TSEL_016207.t1
MKVIAKKFRGVWHYGVITSVVTECVQEDYGGATRWRAIFEDGDTVDLLRSEVRDTSRYVRHMCPKGCVASFSGAPGKAGGWANLPDQHCPECNADRVPGGGGGSGGEEALVLLDGPGIRKVAVLMARVHMSSANAADLGVDAPELLVAGIHARSQDVRTKCKCKCKLVVAGIHARWLRGGWRERRLARLDSPLSPISRLNHGLLRLLTRRIRRIIVAWHGNPPATAPSAVADAVVAGCCEEVALDIAQWQTSSPGQQWAASLVVSRGRAAGIEEDEIDMRKRVTRFVRERRKAHLNAKASTVPAAQLVVAEEAASSAA